MPSAACWRWARTRDYVFNTGSLDVEVASRVETAITSDGVNSYGVGHAVDVDQPFLMVIQHPVTTERDNRAHLEDDAARGGGARHADDLVLAEPGRRHRRDGGEPAALPRAARGADRARCASSPTCPSTSSSRCCSATRAWSATRRPASRSARFSGTPVVNIGGRQQGRLHGGARRARRLRRATRFARPIGAQIAHGRYPPSYIYYRDAASQSMVDVLAGVELYTQKRFCENGAASRAEARSHKQARPWTSKHIAISSCSKRSQQDSRVTQRALATKLGIALGLANIYLKRLVRKGYIKCVNVQSESHQLPDHAARHRREGAAHLRVHGLLAAPLQGGAAAPARRAAGVRGRRPARRDLRARRGGRARVSVAEGIGARAGGDLRRRRRPGVSRHAGAARSPSTRTCTTT